MKIAIVGPSPVPFTIGGAENLMWGLCDAINEYTDHQAELIKLPIKELSFWDLIESYYKFYKLDLSHFDLVITSKYPSWMVRHDNSICYMMHTLRGLYDTYHLMGQPEEVRLGCPQIDNLLNYMENNTNYEALETFFDLIFQLRNENIQESFFSFPGPLIKKIVHYLDYCALSQPGVKKYCAISNTVKARKDYFPQGAVIRTIYPPTTIKNCSCNNYEHIFMISRLDRPKRIDLLIKAMKYIKADVKLYIAGTGPDRERLEKLAKNDDRITFLGFITKEEAERYYANSLVIPYFPYDEDYGYITIEAMLHKKPVITTVDAGGPTEFVIDGQTGYVVLPEEKKIAEKIDYLANNSQIAMILGERGYEMVKNITWEKVVAELLDIIPGREKTAYNSQQQNNKKKITVTSTFSIYPPQGGGQARIYNLYKNIAKAYDVEVVAFDSPDKRKVKTQVASGLFENKIPKSEEHQKEELSIESRVKLPITDIAMLTLSHLTPDYGKELKGSIEQADIVIISHPYLYPEAQKYLINKQFVYEAHNVEYKIKKDMLPDNTAAKHLLQQVYEVECACCRESLFIMTCSLEDKQTLCELYGISDEKVIVVPNGVDCSATRFTPVEDRLDMKLKLGLENEKIGLFMGSWHQPNLDACERIFEIARKCPNVKFLLMGSQCLYFKDKKLPDNVGLLGLVSEEEKNLIFRTVDFALNPMMSGSGTNLKMFDYMSAGIPVISTEFGTRGIDNKEVFSIASVENMPDVIKAFKLTDFGERVNKARKYVEEVFDWSIISASLRDKLKSLGF